MTINRIVVCEVHDDSAWLLRVACFASERPLFGHERQIIEMPDVHEQSHSADLKECFREIDVCDVHTLDAVHESFTIAFLVRKGVGRLLLVPLHEVQLIEMPDVHVQSHSPACCMSGSAIRADDGFSIKAVDRLATLEGLAVVLEGLVELLRDLLASHALASHALAGHAVAGHAVMCGTSTGIVDLYRGFARLIFTVAASIVIRAVDAVPMRLAVVGT